MVNFIVMLRYLTGFYIFRHYLLVMKELTLFLLAASLALTGLSQKYTIKADLTGFPDGTWFYLQDLDVDAIVDSVPIRQGRFAISGRLDDPPQSLWLYSNYQNTFYYTVLLIGNEAVSVKGDIKDFPFHLAITGSPVQDDLNALNHLTRDGYAQRNELLNQYFALKGDSAEIKGKAIWKI